MDAVAEKASGSDPSDAEQREERELLELLRHATLGEYDIYALLGRGGMASVFRAMELSLNRWVAIKVISPSALSSATVIERFWLEARTAASLSHPNVIPIFAVRAVAGLHFFVMKHIQGGSLDVVLRNEGPLTFQIVRTVMMQVAGALAYAHRRGVIHRDIKPANIMLDEEGYAIVMDFGIAKVRDVAALTASGAMVGTPYYMSPEQFNGQAADGRSDQYSLGCVAFELLTGSRPFKGESVPAVLRGHLLDKVPDVRDLRPDCPTSLATVVNRMLCKTPSDRFASMEVLCTQLESMPRVNADVMRERITSLARTASMSNPQISEPMSPVPLSRTSAESLRSGSTQGFRTSRWFSATRFLRYRPWISATVLILGVLTALVAWKQIYSSGSSKHPSQSDAPSRRTIGPSTDRGTLNQDVTRAPSASHERIQSDSLPTPSTTKVNEESKPKELTGTIRNTVSSKPKDSQPRQRNESEPHQAPATPLRVRANAGLAGAVPYQPPVSSIMTPAAGINSFAIPQADPPPPPPPPPSALPAFRVGTRIPAAFLYIDGQQVGLIRGLKTFNHAKGLVHLQIRADDCITWDTVFTAVEGDTAQIGFRNPSCGK